MAISVANAKKLEWLWREENKCEWIEAFIKIADKNGRIVPFKLTPEQREFVKALDNKNLVLKSRQLGLSVVTVALSIRACVINPNTNCLLVSHKQDSCNAIFEKLKQQFFSLPDWLRPEIQSNNRQAITMKNGSSIVCLTAGNKDVGRGSTYNGYVHLSEFAFWTRPEEQLNSLSQAMSDSGTMIIESTANSFNKFSDMYYQAEEHKNAFKAFFFNWINGRTLFEGQYKKSVQTYKNLHGGQMLTESDLDEEELYLLSLGATLDQLCWRRDKVAEGGIDKFHQEYPATPDEAFISTGMSMFDNKRVTSVLSALIKDKVTYLSKDKLKSLPASLRTFYGTSLKIYSMPRHGVKYYAGIDVSEGVGADYSTMVIFDRDGQQVASFKNNKIKPYQFADVVNDLGRYYNKAFLTVEKASGGHSVIERLRYDKKYMNMHKYKTYDQLNRMVWQVGFDTNAKTKSIIVNDCIEWFDSGLIQIKDRDILEEFKVFVMDEDGKMGAVQGSHDDLCMATCLCIAGMKCGFWYSF